MFAHTQHALGIHLSATGMQAVWLMRTPGQAAVCQRVWSNVALDFAAWRHEAAWPKGCVLGVSVASDQVVHAQVALAPGLSWRDRRFQQMAELMLRHPEWAASLCCDEDAQGVVWAIDAATVSQWRDHARTLGCRLRWMGPVVVGEEEALTQAPQAWQAAQLALQRPAPRPNWALHDWQQWGIHIRTTYWQPLIAWARLQWLQSGMNPRSMVLAGCVGALCTCGFMWSLHALGQWRETMTHTTQEMDKLQAQRRELLNTKAQQVATQQAQRARDKEVEESWQPLRAHSQGAVQWMQTLMDAQGVWLREVLVQSESDTSLRWLVRGEALSPVHAQALREQLQALPIWHKPPVDRGGAWLHGQTGRLSVWTFELDAELRHPW